MLQQHIFETISPKDLEAAMEGSVYNNRDIAGLKMLDPEQHKKEHGGGGLIQTCIRWGKRSFKNAASGWRSSLAPLTGRKGKVS